MSATSKAGVALTSIAFLFILIGTFSPGWIGGIGGAQSGLFYACHPVGGCVVYQAGNFSVVFIATLVLMVFAFMLTLPGFFLALSGCRGDASKLKVPGGLFIAGGIFACIAAATFTGLSLPAHSLLARIIVQFFFYGYWMTWIGGVFAIIGGALCVHSSKTTAA